MGFEYALVHCFWTTPPALLLTALYWPLWRSIDSYKILFLIAIAVASSIPWDSYVIRAGLWSYPSDVIIGPTLLDIPLEEVWFFVIQTYITSLLYLLLSKPTLPAVYLVKEKPKDNWKYARIGVQVAGALTIKRAIDWIKSDGHFTYLGMILIWALPFLLLLWSLAYQLLIGLPWTNTILPIWLPTVYLWMVDSLALQRGTWVIASATKTGYHLWPFGLEIEEAIFFLLTNSLIVCGHVAFDNALAILDAFPAHFPRVTGLPSPLTLVRALLLPTAAYDDDRILGLTEAVTRLQNKSRSFYLASATFSGRLRIDLIFLYSAMRVFDDLIDDAKTPTEAREWLSKLHTFLQLSYDSSASQNGSVVKSSAKKFVHENFPPETHLSLLLLPTHLLDKQPLFELLKGFEMDLVFTEKSGQSPIKTDADLDLYSARVAGTVALMCIQLVLHHHPGTPEATARHLMAAGHDMGIALQYTNIARDLEVDAALNRCYVPQPWLKKEKLTTESFLTALCKPKLDDQFLAGKIEGIRMKLLDRAFDFYDRSIDAIEDLPNPARAPMRVAVESYMQIGRVMREPGYRRKAGRATVPFWQRVLVAWRCLQGPRRR
ncbi:hypothetical protein AMS68_004793 [Peltaster fructicola]|uniref:Bifunctional lycopene cyclase/phytoene synthase n=1 Tax=Peltaster fructicola TaxID=286661 RepID=A0A6H0XX69_9PEZI|nr:hypothetical protein AMS68_004793 [Peltaster fructicola]